MKANLFGGYSNNEYLNDIATGLLYTSPSPRDS